MAASELLPVQAFIHAGVPRVTCPRPRRARGPGAVGEAGKRVHALFEAMVVELAKSQPVADIAEQVGEHDTCLWRFIRHTWTRRGFTRTTRAWRP